MITFSNGHQVDFLAASGALGFTGDGYWWEQPFRRSGLLRPEEFTIVTKTLTYLPKVGNLRWWAPWRCVRLLGNGNVVNSVGLSNPGYKQWLHESYNQVVRKGYKVIVSIAPTSLYEARNMVTDLGACKEL